MAQSQIGNSKTFHWESENDIQQIVQHLKAKAYGLITI